MLTYLFSHYFNASWKNSGILICRTNILDFILSNLETIDFLRYCISRQNSSTCSKWRPAIFYIFPFCPKRKYDQFRFSIHMYTEMTKGTFDLNIGNFACSSKMAGLVHCTLVICSTNWVQSYLISLSIWHWSISTHMPILMMHNVYLFLQGE